MSLEQQSPAKQIQRHSWSISEWSALHGFTRIFFYKLRAEGNAPLTMGEGKRTRISIEADRRWVKRQEAKAKKRRA